MFAVDQDPQVHRVHQPEPGAGEGGQGGQAGGRYLPVNPYHCLILKYHFKNLFLSQVG